MLVRQEELFYASKFAKRTESQPYQRQSRIIQSGGRTRLGCKSI